MTNHLSLPEGLRAFPECGNFSAKTGIVWGKTKQLVNLSRPSLGLVADPSPSRCTDPHLLLKGSTKENQGTHSMALRSKPPGEIRGKIEEESNIHARGHLKRNIYCQCPPTHKRKSPVMGTD